MQLQDGGNDESVTQSRPMNSSKVVKWGEIITFLCGANHHLNKRRKKHRKSCISLSCDFSWISAALSSSTSSVSRRSLTLTWCQPSVKDALNQTCLIYLYYNFPTSPNFHSNIVYFPLVCCYYLFIFVFLVTFHRILGSPLGLGPTPVDAICGPHKTIQPVAATGSVFKDFAQTLILKT